MGEWEVKKCASGQVRRSAKSHEAEGFVRAISCDFVDRSCPGGKKARTNQIRKLPITAIEAMSN
jgi:hypothetical protein